MNKMSLKLKITLWFTITLVVISCVSLYVMLAVSTSVLLQEAEKDLSVAVTTFENTLFSHYGTELMIPERALYNDGVQIAVYDSDGDIIFGNNPFGISKLPLSAESAPRRIKYGNDEYYVLDKSIIIGKDTRLWIRGMTSISDKAFAISFTMNYTILFIAFFTLLTGFGGYIIVNKALYPVEKIRSTAQGIIENTNFTKRIDVGQGNDELHTLANTFNTMLDTIESSFDKEKQFTSDASHELRTPIAVILSQCEYVEECVTDVEEAKESVSSIKNQAEKMSKLVSELLWIARADNNKIKIHVEQEDLSELLTYICEEQVEVHGKNIKLHTNIAPNILANIDSSLIARLFINTIQNAYQYNKENGEIFVSLTETNEHATFCVRDTGVGIPQDSLDKIWDRFYQVDQARVSSGNGSSGLGLSMVKWIADAHKASIGIQSEIDKGTTFTLTIHKTINPLSS